MRILYICCEYPPAPHGGIGSNTKVLAEGLAGRGHHVAVVGHDHTGLQPCVNKVGGVTVHRFPRWQGAKSVRMASVGFLRERLHLSKLVKHVCRAFKPDIVESYDWSGPMLRKPRTGHLVVRMHGAQSVCRSMMGERASRLVTMVEGRNLRMADSLVAVSELIRDMTTRCFCLAAKAPVIYNGVDLSRFRPGDSSSRDLNRLLYVGRVHPQKGVDLLVRAMEIVLRHAPEVYLDVVGPTESRYARELLHEVPDAVKERIVFRGRIDNEDLPSVYASANLCVAPSRVEALGIVPLEAMACGTPVVCSCLGAAREIIDDGVDGFIEDPRTCREFAERILSALSTPQEIDAMRMRCRSKVVERFGLEGIVAKNEDFYAACLA